MGLRHNIMQRLIGSKVTSAGGWLASTNHSGKDAVADPGSIVGRCEN